MSIDADDAGVAEYRALSGLAVGALVLGILSLGALLTAVLWLASLAGIILALVALQRIAEEWPELGGRRLALAGLLLSLVSLVAAPVDWSVHRLLVRREAQQFALRWFEYLQQQSPQKAHQLTIGQGGRQPLEDPQLWKYYTGDWRNYQDIKSFVQKKEIAALVALGDRAQVRYYDTEAEWSADGTDYVEQTYAVTFTPGPGPKTFFVTLVLERRPDTRGGQSYWKLERFEGGTHPRALGGTALRDAKQK